MDERVVEVAQALLTGFDTALSRQWREEDRRWRQEDLMMRDKELFLMDEQRRWRQADMEQRCLDNARVLWARVVERNRRDVDEKSEQLKAISTLAALISGFALTAFLQFDWNEDFIDRSGIVLPLFGLSMALTVGLETTCVIICSLMLVSIFKTGQSYMSEDEEAEFVAKCKAFLTNYRPGERPPAPTRSFAMHWAQRCEQSWRRAFLLFGAGIPALFTNLSVAAWIKFSDSIAAAILTTVVMGISLMAMAFFHRKWSSHILAKEQIELHTERVPIAPMGMPWDWHLRPQAYARARPCAAAMESFECSSTDTTGAASAAAAAATVW